MKVFVAPAEELHRHVRRDSYAGRRRATSRRHRRHRTALRVPLRAGHCHRLGRRVGPVGSEAWFSRRWERRRHLVFHPRARRGPGRRLGHERRRFRCVQRRRRRAGARLHVAAFSRSCRRRQAAPTSADVARETRHRRRRCHDDDGSERRRQHESQAGAGLATHICQLAHGFCGRSVSGAMTAQYMGEDAVRR